MRALPLLIALLAVPALTGNNVVLTVLIFTFILGILAVSFNLIFGFTGQLSLFHAAAFGLSAYATYLSMDRWGIPFWLGLVVGVVFVALVSVVIGAICFRFKLRELYFAIVTLAFSELARLVVLNWSSFTNGSLGINFALTPTLWLPGRGVVPVAGTTMWYYLSLVALALAVLFYSRVIGSWMGRCLAAIRLNDDLADTLGINVFRYKLIAFVAANAGAAVAGSLYAFYSGYIDPGYFSVDQSLAVIAMALLGGREYVAAPVVGAFVLTALPHVIDVNAEARILIYGLILIFTILLMPRGIVGLLLRRRRAA
jgi:branched-chain amino acid transport system permease protein